MKDSNEQPNKNRRPLKYQRFKVMHLDRIMCIGEALERVKGDADKENEILDYLYGDITKPVDHE